MTEPLPERRLVSATGVASGRLIRVMAVTDAVAVLVFGLLAAPSIIAQWSFIPAWWCTAIVTVILAPGLLLFGAALRGPLVLVRALLTLIAAGYLLAIVSFPLVLAGRTVPEHVASPWIFSISTVATAAAAIAWRPAFAWASVGMASVGLFVGRIVAYPGPIVDIALQDAVFAFMFDTVFTALGLALRRAARLQDSAAADADAEARAASVADALARERGRVETLVHDTVLVALLASARGAPAELVAAEARRAIDELDTVGDEESGTVDPDGAVWAIQAVVTELDPDAVFGYELAGDRPVPSGVVHAIAEATAEAVRNSLRHAGEHAHRGVHVVAGADAMEVTVIDDGRGFDPQSVGPARLGIAVSIIGRMRATPGGDAILLSRIGVGTRIVLRWHEEEG